MTLVISGNKIIWCRYGLVGEPDRLVKKREMGIFTDRLHLICPWPIKRMVMMRKMRIFYGMPPLVDNDE